MKNFTSGTQDFLVLQLYQTFLVLQKTSYCAISSVLHRLRNLVLSQVWLMDFFQRVKMKF